MNTMARRFRGITVALATLVTVLISTTLVSTTALAARDLSLPAPPFASDTLGNDGSSMLTNPANAAFRTGFDAGLGLNMMSSVQVGDGVYTYLNYTLPFRLSLGGGLAARFGEDRGLTGFASVAWAAGPLAIGLRYRVYQAKHDPMHGVSTSDLGFTLRPARFVAFSGVITNLWTPRLRTGDVLAREFRFENGWRLPCGRLGFAAQWIARKWDLEYDHHLGWHLDARVVNGVRVFASGTHRVIEGTQGLGPHQNQTTIQAGIQLQTAGLSQEVAVRWADGDGRVLGASALFRYSSNPNAPLSFPSGQLLKVQLSGTVEERPNQNLLGPDSRTFSDLMWALRQARDSKQVEGVYLHLSGVKLGVAQLWEVRQALDDIRHAGRRVVVYLEQGGLRDLYLAAAGEYIMASPAFFSSDAGLRVERFFLADLLQTVGIEATFVRVGRYKSAVEMFTRNEPSAFADEALRAYVTDVWDVISRGICTHRSNAACPNGQFPFDRPISADALRASGWLNDLGYEDEFNERLTQNFERRYRTVRASDLHNRDVEAWGNTRHIAVLHISGDIVSGKSGANPLTGKPFTGSDTVEQAVREILASRQAHGVIIRVNSPGGSAFASDEMLRAVSGLERAGIPTVVSFGDAAASGGYYVAAFPTTIFSPPTTVTGSIGIYAGTFAVDELLTRAGVRRESMEVGGPARLFAARQWNAQDLEWMQASVEHGYERFTELVADARSMSVDELQPLAEGRIWSGKAAVEHGLVDQEGGFLQAYDALCASAPRCARQPYPLQHYGQVFSLSLPGALSAVLRMDHENIDATNLRGLLEQSGLGGILGTILAILPSNVGETRADLGGVFRVTFE